MPGTGGRDKTCIFLLRHSWKNGSLFSVLSPQDRGSQVVWSGVGDLGMGASCPRRWVGGQPLGQLGAECRASSWPGEQPADPRVLEWGWGTCPTPRIVGQPPPHLKASGWQQAQPNWSHRMTELSRTLYEPLNHPLTQSSKHSRHNGNVYT